MELIAGRLNAILEKDRTRGSDFHTNMTISAFAPQLTISERVLSENNLTVSRLGECQVSGFRYFVKGPSKSTDIPHSTKCMQIRRSFSLMRGLAHLGILRPIELIERESEPHILYTYKSPTEWRELDIDTLLSDPTRILLQVGNILDFLHLKGVAHRDVKLMNFLVNSSLNVLLTDHDFVQREGEDSLGLIFGTPDLLPEKTRAVHRHLDLHSLGQSIQQGLQELDSVDGAVETVSKLQALAKSLIQEEHSVSVLELIKRQMTVKDKDLEMYRSTLVRSHITSSLRDEYLELKDFGSAVGKALSAQAGVTGYSTRLVFELSSIDWRWSDVKSLIQWCESLEFSQQPSHLHFTPSSEALCSLYGAISKVAISIDSVSAIRDLHRDGVIHPLKALTLSSRAITEEDRPRNYLLRVVRLKALRKLQLRTEVLEELTHILKMTVLSQSARERYMLLSAKLHGAAGENNSRYSLELPHFKWEMELLDTWLVGLLGDVSGALKSVRAINAGNGYLKSTLLCKYYEAVFLSRLGDHLASERVLSRRFFRDCAPFADLSYLAYTQRGIAEFETGRYEKARGSLTKALACLSSASSQTVAPAYLLLANICIRSGRHKEAASHLDNYLSQSAMTQARRAYFNYSWGEAWLSQSQGEYDKAYAIYSHLCSIATSSSIKASILLNIADIYLCRGDERGFSQTVAGITILLEEIDDESIAAQLDGVKRSWEILYMNGGNSSSLEHIHELARSGHRYAAANCLFFQAVSCGQPESLTTVWDKVRGDLDTGEAPLYASVETLIRDTRGASQALKSELTPFHRALMALQLSRSHRGSGNKLSQMRYAERAHELFTRIGNTARQREAESLMKTSNALEDLTRHYSVICDTLQQVNAEESMLDTLLDHVMSWSGAERVAIVLERENRQGYYIPAYRNIESHDLSDVKDISMSIAKNTLLLQQPFIIEDAKNNPDHKLYKSVVQHDIRSVLSIPFTTTSELKGALYLAHHTLDSFFKKDDLDFLRAIARFVGLAIGISRERHSSLESKSVSRQWPTQIIVRDKRMLSFLARINRLAKRDIPILITGERGVGKELIARQIHANSERSRNPFKAINCASISQQHINSELFGVAANAFSGVNKRLGAIRAADGGTLFLDEVGDLSLEAQASLLRALDYQEITPLGSDDVFQTDVRFVYGTNKDLVSLAKQDRFREDFLDRIMVVHIEVPALRERTEDVEALIDHFAQLNDLARPDGAADLSVEARAALRSFSWPGNVRELQNLFAEVAAEERGRTIQLSDLPDKVLDEYTEKAPVSQVELDKEHYRRFLEAHDYNVSKVSRVLKVNYNTLRSRLKKLGLI